MIGQIFRDRDGLVVTLEDGWVWTCNQNAKLAATLNDAFPRGTYRVSDGAPGASLLARVSAMIGGNRVEFEIKPKGFDPDRFEVNGDLVFEKDDPKALAKVSKRLGVDLPG